MLDHIWKFYFKKYFVGGGRREEEGGSGFDEIGFW